MNSVSVAIRLVNNLKTSVEGGVLSCECKQYIPRAAVELGIVGCCFSKYSNDEALKLLIMHLQCMNPIQRLDLYDQLEALVYCYISDCGISFEDSINEIRNAKRHS